MPEQQVESKQPAPGDERKRLKSLCEAIDKDVDSNLPGQDDMEKIGGVLKEIMGKLTAIEDGGDDGKKDGGDKQQQQALPDSKMEELRNLLPTIERAMEQRKHPRKQDGEVLPADAAEKKLLLSAAMGCNPCKPWLSQQQGKQQLQQQQQPEEDEAVSLKLLLRLAQNVLEPEQYYEWTTSYVDVDRIYGWDTDADDVATSLVAPDDAGSQFRAAGITGIHGSGKTVLAQKVFVHDKAKDNFALRLWVCVGPPDSEDRFGLLYRMLDNLGLDTAKVEDNIVANSKVVQKQREAVAIRKDPAKVADIRKKAAEDAQRNKEGEDANKVKEEEDRIYNQLLKEEEEVEESPEVQKSKIGVLLYILHMTLSKTSYMIVFDDIRAYGDDGWYSNLALPPPSEGEWGDRLAYGLPKGSHKGAVLVTCRKEDDARSMVRTGHVVRPPKLEGDDAWKLFTREYEQAKSNKKQDGKPSDDGKLLLNELEQMKADIVEKCLGLPVAIAEAAKGFALLDPLPDEDLPMKDIMQPPPPRPAAPAGDEPEVADDDN